MRGTTLDATKPVTQQLAEALHQSLGRVIRLFQEWDLDGDGQITKKELTRALQSLGLAAGSELNKIGSELFEELDRDGSVRARVKAHRDAHI